jgi:hypothetical protein
MNKTGTMNVCELSKHIFWVYSDFERRGRLNITDNTYFCKVEHTTATTGL